jgi:hypothetical protein
VLDHCVVGNFTKGLYQSWRISGKLRVTIRKTEGPNANISGIFLDPADK